MSDFNTGIIEEFRANNGKVGGMFEGAPLLILHTTGARSGTNREAPLMYLSLDDRMFVFASKSGATTHPDWYHNAVANPSVEVELGDSRTTKTAVVLDRVERDAIYA
ncbi:MAG: nitroreductase family deazaflavin-dependent oxidoreductase, partial [Actinomycetia bacterium]|nr:nitroreductase family deazaflavin-dependent oxidoreductase [Actinomycetes bacterium]